MEPTTYYFIFSFYAQPFGPLAAFPSREKERKNIMRYGERSGRYCFLFLVTRLWKILFSIPCDPAIPVWLGSKNFLLCPMATMLKTRQQDHFFPYDRLLCLHWRHPYLALLLLVSHVLYLYLPSSLAAYVITL